MMSTAAASESVRNNNNSNMSGGRYNPFTASQWAELEHQALVYKYMISGMPIPPDLLFTIKTSLLDSSSSSTKLLLHHQPPHSHPSIGWNCFQQMGYGRKIDPEPGRCRRTDGKKWRCSKEAYPDSKYCERHMHRGRNRSRKPVELLNNNNNNNHNHMMSSIIPKTPPPPSAIPIMSSSKSQNYPSPNSHPLISSSSSSSDYYSNNLSLNHNNNNTIHLSSSAYSVRPCVNGIGNALSSQDHFLLESTPYRKSYGMKEEHPFLSESSSAGTIKSSLGMGDSWQLDLDSCSKQRPFSNFHQQQNGGYLLYNNNHQLNESYDYDHHQLLALKLERKDEEPQKKVMHHFFDEWPPAAANDDVDKDSSTTQLSISIPTSAHDFFLTRNNGK